MTDPWNPDIMSGTPGEQEEFFNVRDAQGHLLLVRIQDEVLKFATKDCPDGTKLLMRGPNKGKTVPNNVVRATIADLTLPHSGSDPQPGKIYHEAVIFAGTLVKDLKRYVGKTFLMVWKQDDPTDKSSPYSYQLYNENPEAVAIAREFLERHPEFMTIPAPAPYVLAEPPQQAPQYQGPPPQQWQQQPGVQQYPPAQPQWAPPQYPQAPSPQQYPDPWNQPGQGARPGAPQWQQPQAQPQWQTSAPPAPQGNGSFLSRAQAQPDYYNQHDKGVPVNHHGQPQSEEPPY